MSGLGLMAQPLRTFLRYWLPLLIYIGLIFIFSSLSKRPHSILEFIPDKLLHFIEYALLAALTARAVYSLPKPGTWWVVLLITFIAVATLGTLDELYQSTIPRRSPEFLDWVADASGGLLGGICYLLLKRWLVRRAETFN
jgi:VanZ family protein